MAEGLSAVYSLRRPKNLLAGVSSGVKTIAKSTGLGLVCLVGAPVAMASEEGAKGAAKGVALGLASVVALPLAGVCVAATQIGRGLFNTGEEVMHRSKGHYWDQESRAWVDYDPARAIVDEKYIVVQNLTYDAFLHLCRGLDGAHIRANSEATPGGKVSGPTDYYDCLGVASDASPEEIKREYYRRARELHPDRNPDDEAANQNFQRLSMAYQVLSDPNLRAAYDRNGASADFESGEMEDVGLLFTMLFGSYKFEGYFGTPVMVLTREVARHVEGTSIDLQRALLRRRVEVTQRLAQRLDRLANIVARDGGVDQVNAELLKEAERLVEASYGPRLLGTIARKYRAGAAIGRGGLSGLRSRLQGPFRRLGYAMRSMKSLVSVGKAHERFERESAIQRESAERQRQEQVMARSISVQDLSEESETESTGTGAGDAFVNVSFVSSERSRNAPSSKSRPVPTHETSEASEVRGWEAAPSSSSSDDEQSTGAETRRAPGGEVPSSKPAGRGATPAGEAGAKEDSESEPLLDEEEQRQREQALFGDSLPALLEALWCGMELDLDDLLREATAVVLKGNSHGLPAVDPAVRDQRIKMLALVADVFEAVSTNYLATHPEPPASESLERAAMAAAVFRQHGADADVDIDAVYREWQAAGGASAQPE